jgi:hypothetical protein
MSRKNYLFGYSKEYKNTKIIFLIPLFIIKYIFKNLKSNV